MRRNLEYTGTFPPSKQIQELKTLKRPQKAVLQFVGFVIAIPTVTNLTHRLLFSSLHAE